MANYLYICGALENRRWPVFRLGQLCFSIIHSMKYLLAIDSFKGCLSSAEAEQAAAEAIHSCCKDAQIVSIPVSDGGDGMLEAFVAAMKGQTVTVDSHDALMRSITASYGIVVEGLCENGACSASQDGSDTVKTAVIETAKACGLALLNEEEHHPLVATTYGVGELLADAVKRGCQKFIIGLGGSATSDCGIGMLRALTDIFGSRGDSHWKDVAGLFKELSFTLASDVNNPLYGENGAAHVYAPQKGATPEQVELLDSRAKKFADISARHFGFDRSQQPGAGAAGGLGYAFMQYLGAEAQSGAHLLLNKVNFDEQIKDVDGILTGEGSADAQTLMGKLPAVVLQRAQRQNVPVVLLAGKVKERELLLRAGFSDVLCINPEGADPSESMRPEVAKERIKAAVPNCLK